MRLYSTAKMVVAILAFAQYGVLGVRPVVFAADASAAPDSSHIAPAPQNKPVQVQAVEKSAVDTGAVSAKAEKFTNDSAGNRESANKQDIKGAPVKAVKVIEDSITGKEKTPTGEPASKIPVKTAKPAPAPVPAAIPAKAQAPAKVEPKTPEDFKKLGDQFVKKSQTDKAMAAYKQCIDKSSGDTAYAKITKMYADYCVAKKQYAEAVKYLSMITGKAREQVSFQITYGRCLQLTGKNAEAIELIEPLTSDVKLKPDVKKEMYKILGDAYYKSDLIDKSNAWYGKYLKLNGPKTPDMMYVVGVFLEKISPLKAKSRYEENIKTYPTDYRNYLRLGMLLSKNKATLQRSENLLKKTADLAGSNPSVWIEIGRVYEKAGKIDEELSAYQTSLRIDTANLEAKIRIGSILLGKGLTMDAIGILEGAHRQAPDSLGPMIALAGAYIKTNKPKEAIDLLEKAKAAKPKDALIRKQLYEALKANGQDQQALEEIKASIDLKRDNESLLAYGKMLLKLGKFPEAANVMEDIRSTAPENIEALMTLAMALRGQKKLDEALELYKEASSIDPKAAMPLYERAETHVAQNKLPWAEQFYKRALEADPKLAVAEVGLAKIALAHNNRQVYLELLEKASSMDPENPVVKQEIENSKKPAPAGKK
jgi:tetratricopeptide (TPR) repeat protein